MKAYKVEILVIDHDEVGKDEIQSVIENTNYPNDCIMPDVMSIESADIGKWSDTHPLNSSLTVNKEYKKLFPINTYYDENVTR